MKVIFSFISFHSSILPRNITPLFFEMIKNVNACFPRVKNEDHSWVLFLVFCFYFWL